MPSHIQLVGNCRDAILIRSSLRPRICCHALVLHLREKLRWQFCAADSERVPWLSDSGGYLGKFWEVLGNQFRYPDPCHLVDEFGYMRMNVDDLFRFKIWDISDCLSWEYSKGRVVRARII